MDVANVYVDIDLPIVVEINQASIMLLFVISFTAGVNDESERDSIRHLVVRHELYYRALHWMHEVSLLYSSSFNQQMAYAVGFPLNKPLLLLLSSAELEKAMDLRNRIDIEYHCIPDSSSHHLHLV